MKTTRRTSVLSLRIVVLAAVCMLPKLVPECRALSTYNVAIDTTAYAGGSGTLVFDPSVSWTVTPQPPTGVPDGGATVALLGFSLAGLIALRRRTAHA